MNTLPKIMTFKAKSPTNLMRKIKEFTGAKKFLMHKDKIILDDTLVIYYIQEGKEYIVKRVEEKNEKEFIWFRKCDFSK